jgi:hypothetical protein
MKTRNKIRSLPLLSWAGVHNLQNEDGMDQYMIEQRLADLRKELDVGRHTQATLEEKSRTVQAQMLRIGGAIQVLEELLNSEQAKEREGNHSTNGAAATAVHVG